MDAWIIPVSGRAYCLYCSFIIIHTERGEWQASLAREKSAPNKNVYKTPNKTRPPESTLHDSSETKTRRECSRCIAFRFQISSTTVSRYFITWVCFLYQELCEIEWFPSKDQVAGTLSFSFRERYPTTVSIIDASEVFIQTPSDLMLQSTAWSNYKHHNTM